MSRLCPPAEASKAATDAATVIVKVVGILIPGYRSDHGSCAITQLQA